MQFARTFSVPEPEDRVAKRICEYMSQIGYRKSSKSGNLIFRRGSFLTVLSSLSPGNAPSKATVCLDASDHKTRVSAVLDAKLLPPYTQGEFAYFETELSALEDAAWGRRSAEERVSAAEEEARSPGKGFLKIMVVSTLVQVLICLGVLLTYGALSRLVDGRYLLVIALGLLGLYYARYYSAHPATLDFSLEGIREHVADSLKQRLIVSFFFIAAWLPFAPNTTLVAAVVIGIFLLSSPWMSNGGFLTLMATAALAIGVSSTYENPALWGVSNSPSLVSNATTRPATPVHAAQPSGPTATAAAVSTAVAELRRKAMDLQIPSSGSNTLTNKGAIDTKVAVDRARDFVIETRFFNPYDRAEGSWDYGFMFREVGLDRDYQISVDSNRKWDLYSIGVGTTSGSRLRRISGGSISDLDVSPNGSNQLRLVANGGTGYWFVNDKFVSTLDIFEMADPGVLRIATGFERVNRIEGREVKYEGLRAWSVQTLAEATASGAAAARPSSTPQAQRGTPPEVDAAVVALRQKSERLFGPESGSMIQKDTAISTWAAVERTRDFIAEARFSNPYDRAEADWDYGFIFRRVGPDRNYRLYVDSNRNWVLTLTRVVGTEQEFEDFGRGVIDDLDVSATGSNRLRLAVEGNTGYFFVNDRFVTKLDVTAQTDPGGIGTGAGFMRSHKLAGRETKFQDFTIWGVVTPANATATAVARARADATGTPRPAATATPGP